MRSEMKRKLIANMMPALVPVGQAAVHYHFDRKMLDKKMDHEVQLAERRAQAMAAMTGDNSMVSSPSIGSDTRPPQVYDSLERLRAETQCGFCQSAADALLQQDRETAAEGLAELQQYHDYLDEARSQNKPAEQVEADIQSIVEGWQVVPGVIGGV